MEIDETWYVGKAIRDQIEKEDTVGWALKEEHLDQKAMKVQLASGKWQPTAEFVFSRLFKKFQP